LAKNQELYDSFYYVGIYLEGMGVLVRENLVDIRLVSELTSGYILQWWKQFGPGVKCREAWKFPRYCIEIEYLAKRIAQYAKEHPELGIVAPDWDFYQ
jgi:hypothetical protein